MLESIDSIIVSLTAAFINSIIQLTFVHTKNISCSKQPSLFEGLKLIVPT